MKIESKTTLEIHRELTASGIFKRETQTAIASRIKVNQGTVSRIASGRFKRLNKSVRAICKYADIGTIKESNVKQLRSMLSSRANVSDPVKKKLVDIIGLAVDLLDRA